MAGTKPLSLNQAVSSSLFAPALPSVMWPSLRAASKAYDLTEESNDPAEPMAANTVNTSNSEVPNIFGLGSDGSGTSEAPGTPAEADKDIKQEKIAPSSEVKKEHRKRIKLEKQSPPSDLHVQANQGDIKKKDAHKNSHLRLLWEHHDEHGLCTGSNQLPCCFGVAGAPAGAGPGGRCDLCTTQVLEALHDDGAFGRARITHLLKQLEGKPLEHALVRVKLALGEEAQLDYAHRRARALYRSLQRQQRGRIIAGEVNDAEEQQS